jgi:Uma2 family endonuclease
VSRAARDLPTYTYEDYRRFEDANPARHEYVDGYILAMAGGTPVHARLQGAVLFCLERLLEGSPCQPFPSDLRVRVRATGLATYPDVTVVCEAVETDVDDPHAVVNPTVIVEVSSDRTEAYDRGEKFEHYRQIPTLREYVLVSHRERRIEVRSRQPDGTWRPRQAGRGERVALAALGVELVVDDVYDRSSLTRAL